MTSTAHKRHNGASSCTRLPSRGHVTYTKTDISNSVGAAVAVVVATVVAVTVQWVTLQSPKRQRRWGPPERRV